MSQKQALELLAPAGDMQKLKVAFHFGADAVYVGLDQFSLRKKTKNFSIESLKEAVFYTHSLGKKIYVACNVYLHPEEVNRLIEVISSIEEIKPDALIVSDLGVFRIARKYAPSVPLHVSTQANTTNQEAVLMYKELGASRVILARELTLREIAVINKACDLELETFVHGAMCIAYSGRCLLSSYMTHEGLGKRENDKSSEVRSANDGNCVHACRWEYALVEPTRKNDEFPIEEDASGTYILSSKDICMIDHVEDLANAGISSLKIEGRMKSVLYISSIVNAYRYMIDSYYKNEKPLLRDQVENELNVVSHRVFSTGFFFDSPRKNAHLTKGGTYKRTRRLAALVDKILEDGKALLYVYNTIRLTDELEYCAPFLRVISVGRVIFYDEKNNVVDEVKHDQTVSAQFYDKAGNIIISFENDIIRMTAHF